MCVCVCVNAHKYPAHSCSTPISHHHWWKLPNPRYLIKRTFFGDTQIRDCLWCLITFLESRGANCLANSNFWCKNIYFFFLFSGGLMFYSPLAFFLQFRGWDDEYCAAHHQTQREKPQRSGQWRGGEGGVEREGTVREKCYVGQWRIALGYCLLSSQSGKLIWFPVNPSDLNYERLPSLKITLVTASALRGIYT